MRLRLCSGKFDNLQLSEQRNDRIGRIEFPFLRGKIAARRKLVVIVVIALAHHQPVYFEQILRRIVGFKIYVPVFVRKPVNDNTVQGSHDGLKRNQEKPPQRRRKN